jgi:hypothetical protein
MELSRSGDLPAPLPDRFKRESTNICAAHNIFAPQGFTRGGLMNTVATDTEFQSYVAVFILGFPQLGWVEGQNLRVDVRWNAGNAGPSHGVNQTAG